jgi:hypothetical protein
MTALRHERPFYNRSMCESSQREFDNGHQVDRKGSIIGQNDVSTPSGRTPRGYSPSDVALRTRGSQGVACDYRSWVFVPQRHPALTGTGAFDTFQICTISYSHRLGLFRGHPRSIQKPDRDAYLRVVENVSSAAFLSAHESWNAENERHVVSPKPAATQKVQT